MGNHIINPGNGFIVNDSKNTNININNNNNNNTNNNNIDFELIKQLDKLYNEYKESYPEDEENILLIDNAKKSILNKNKIDIPKYLTPLLNLTKNLSVNVLLELINKKLLML